MGNLGANQSPHTWQWDTVFDLFTSGASWYPRGWPTEYHELAAALNEGWVIATRARYRPGPMPTLESADLERFLQAFNGPGSARHAQLKWSAWNWLYKREEPAPKYEQWVEGRRVDLVARRLRYVVECGDTDPRRVFDTLENREWRRFVLFPFGENVAYLFRLTQVGHRVLARRRADLWERMVEAVNRLPVPRF